VLDYIIAKGSISPVRRGTLKELKDEKPKEISNEYRLEQDYPNPFNPGIVISCRLTVK
jgi:hypothetical protein